MHVAVGRSSLVLACLLGIGALAGCKGEVSPGGADRRVPGTCVADADCPNGKICVGGLCVEDTAPTCDAEHPCPSGMTCNELQGVCQTQMNPDGGNNGDGGGGGTCSARCDCPYDSTCQNGQCVAVSLGTSCAQDNQCGRGQVCNFSHQCEAGCADTCDCMAPKMCSPTRFKCETCSPSNPCPTGQFCSGSGASAQCIPNVSCTGSSDCNSASPGSICVNGNCTNCTLDNQCQSAPYGGGYICSAGVCQTGCNVSQCQTTCTQQGLTCNTVSCQCDAASCTDQNCGGVACTGTDVCDSTCTCVPFGTSTSCAQTGCSNGQTCVQVDSSGGFPGCTFTGSACATDCSANSCPSGWDCVDLTQSICATFGGLTPGQFCAKECSSAADCPGGQSCCDTSEGYKVCSALGACITQ